jgi:hypothetical protein
MATLYTTTLFKNYTRLIQFHAWPIGGIISRLTTSATFEIRLDTGQYFCVFSA